MRIAIWHRLTVLFLETQAKFLKLLRVDVPVPIFIDRLEEVIDTYHKCSVQRASFGVLIRPDYLFLWGRRRRHYPCAELLPNIFLFITSTTFLSIVRPTTTAVATATAAPIAVATIAVAVPMPLFGLWRGIFVVV